MTSKRTYADDPNCLARSSTSSLLRLVPLGPHRLRFRKRVYPDVDELAILELLRRGILLGSEIDTGGGRWIPLVDHPAFEGLIDALGEEIPRVISEHRPGQPDEEVTRPAESLPRPPSQMHDLEEESSDFVGDYNTSEQWLPQNKKPSSQPDEGNEILETEVLPSDNVSLEDFRFTELQVDEVDDSMDATPTAALPDDRTIAMKQPPTAILSPKPPALSPSKPAALRFPIGQTPPKGSKSLAKAQREKRARSAVHREAPIKPLADPAPKPAKSSYTCDIPRPSEVREQQTESGLAHCGAPRSASLPKVPNCAKLPENPSSLNKSRSWPLIVAGLIVLILAASAAAVIFYVQI